jgi:hypothetical protein
MLDIRMMGPRAFDHGQSFKNAIALRESRSRYGKNLYGHRRCPAASIPDGLSVALEARQWLQRPIFPQIGIAHYFDHLQGYRTFVLNIVSPSSNNSPGHKVRLTHSSISIPISINFVGRGLERTPHFDWYLARTSPNRFR